MTNELYALRKNNANQGPRIQFRDIRKFLALSPIECAGARDRPD